MIQLPDGRDRDWIGIDPGLSGAWAIVRRDGTADAWPVLSHTEKLKTKTRQGNAKRRTVLDLAETFLAFRRTTGWPRPDLGVALEVAGPAPRFGSQEQVKFGGTAQSSYSLGRCIGQWEGHLVDILLIDAVSLVPVHPKTWRARAFARCPDLAALGKPGATKRAIALFPECEALVKGYRGHNVAEALLIAWAARETYNKGADLWTAQQQSSIQP